MKEINNRKLLVQYFKQFNLDRIFEDNIINHLMLIEYDKGEYICRNGDKLVNVYFLIKGEVKVFTTLDNGKIYLLRTEEPLSFYGDIELLKEEFFSANVETLTRCKCIGISVDYLRKNYINNPKLLRYLCLSLSQRLDSISHISTTNLYLPLINKLSGYLLLHKPEDSLVMTLKNNLTDISDQLGVTYRHLSRTFKQLEEDHIIIRRNKTITILNYKKLSELAGNVYR